MTRALIALAFVGLSAIALAIFYGSVQLLAWLFHLDPWDAALILLIADWVGRHAAGNLNLPRYNP